VTATDATAARARRDTPRIARRDLKYLWIDVRFAGSTMKHEPDSATEAASSLPDDVVDRIETELAGEADRYRYALYACIAVILMPGALAAFAWSGLHWLPVRVMWFPFDRGYYGLPWLSLYEWVAYLLLALFFVVGFALVALSHTATRRLSSDYRRLAGADEAGRRDFAAAVRRAGLARTELVMRSSRVFADYRAALDAVASPDAAAPAPAEPAVPEPTGVAEGDRQ
jgi:hypothetical protein